MARKKELEKTLSARKYAEKKKIPKALQVFGEQPWQILARLGEYSRVLVSSYGTNFSQD